MKSVEIEQLEKSDKPEVLELFTQAFTDYPLIPAKPKANKALIKTFLDFFGGTKSFWLYGIRACRKN